MDTDWKDSLQREVWVFDVSSVDFFILIEKIWVLEFLDWLFGDLGDPVVHS